MALAGPRIAPDLQVCDTKPQCDVILRFKESAEAGALPRLISRGAVHKQALALIRSHVMSINSRELRSLIGDGDVESVGPDRPLRSTAFSGTLDYSWMAVAGIARPTGTLPYDGTGIAIALIDGESMTAKT